jgi:hypothetical protein
VLLLLLLLLLLTLPINRLRGLADSDSDVDVKMRLRRLFRTLQGVDEEVRGDFHNGGNFIMFNAICWPDMR